MNRHLLSVGIRCDLTPQDWTLVTFATTVDQHIAAVAAGLDEWAGQI